MSDEFVDYQPLRDDKVIWMEYGNPNECEDEDCDGVGCSSRHTGDVYGVVDEDTYIMLREMERKGVI